MKKNKSFTVFLLVLVILIWAGVFCRIYKSPSPQTILAKNKQNITQQVEQNLLKDYELHSYTRDPFLSIISDTALKEILPDTPTRRIQPVEVVLPLLPKYCGIITHEKTKTAIIFWRQKYEQVQEGNIFDSLKITSVNEKELGIKKLDKIYKIPLEKSKNARERDISGVKR